MKKLKFAFVGCGQVAPFHADVVKHLGHHISVVVAKEHSSNIHGFAEQYGIEQKVYGVDQFLEYYRKHNNMIDCVLVCTPWNVTSRILEALLPLGIPVMAEKPAVLSMATLSQLKEKCDTNNLFVAYNRRFYDFIPSLKELIASESPVCVDVLSAEPCEMITENHGKEICEYMLYFYTSHVIDLMYYLFGDVDIKNVVDIARGRKESWVCELYSAKHKCPIQLKILMDCPQNSYFKIFFEKKVAEMCPFEKMVIYDKLERVQKDGKAHYTPQKQLELSTCDKYKPGFLNQMKHFVENFVYKSNQSSEYMEQLEKVTVFCDTLRNLRRCHG